MLTTMQVDIIKHPYALSYYVFTLCLIAYTHIYDVRRLNRPRVREVTLGDKQACAVRLTFVYNIALYLCFNVQ